MSQNVKIGVSIVTRALVKIGTRILLVVVTVAAISYAVLFSKQEDSAIQYLEKYTALQGLKEQNEFLATQQNVNLYANEVIRILNSFDSNSRYYKYLNFFGYVKNNDQKYKEKIDQSEKSKWSLATLKGAIDYTVAMVNTWSEDYPQIWIVLNDGTRFGILDDGDDFPSLKMAGDKAHWSKPWYDDRKQRWLIDYSQALVLSGERLGQVSFRVNITDKINAMKKNLLLDSKKYIADQSGQIVMAIGRDVDGNIENIQPKDLEKDVSLKSAIGFVISRNLQLDVALLRDSKIITASNFISGPNWYSVNVYPKGWTHQEEGGVLIWIVLSSLVYLIFELFILASTLYQEIGLPIRKILKSKQLNTEGESGRIVFEPVVQALQKLGREVFLCDEAIETLQKQIDQEVTKKDADIAVAKKELLQKLTNTESHGVNKSLESIAAGLTFEIFPAVQRLDQALGQIKDSMSLKEWSSTEILRKCSFIENEIQKTSKIVTGFLVFARDSKKEEFQLTDLSKVVDIALSLCVHRFRREGVILEVSEIPNIQVECRMAQLTQVLFGLLNNAFEAVQDESKKQIQLEFKLFNENLYIEIKDSGKGVPEQLREKIFEPFFSTKSNMATYGLGLAEARSILRAHHGEISLSQVAVQTTFTVQLPIKQEVGFE